MGVRSELNPLLVLSLLLAAAPLAACSPFDDHRRSLERLHAQGRYDLAARTLDEPRIRRRYGRKNHPLWLMDRGAVALALDNHETAIQRLHEADKLFERRREATPAQSAAALILNDRAVPYYADPWEDMYLNVLKLLAQLERGVIVGGATVEARRLALKANLLRDRYLSELRVASEQAPIDPLATADPELRRLAALDTQGRFIESPLGLFLSAIAFMEAGEPQNRSVAARRLQEAIAAQGDLIGDLDPKPFEPLETLTPADVDVLVVALSGRGPVKRPYRVGPIPIGTVPIYFELPVLDARRSDVAEARVVVETIESPPDADPPERIASPLFLVESLANVAEVNHRRALPLIYTRTLLRAAAKSTALTFANEAVRNSTNSDAALLGAIIGSFALLAITERADLRTWTFLPAQAHAGLLNLGPGRHRLRIEYLAPTGGLLYASAWRTLEIDPASDLQTIVEHYWR